MAKIRHKGNIPSTPTESTVSENTDNTQAETPVEETTQAAATEVTTVTTTAVETPAIEAPAIETPAGEATGENIAAENAEQAPVETPVVPAEPEAAVAAIEAPAAADDANAAAAAVVEEAAVQAPVVAAAEVEVAGEQDVSEEVAYLNNIRLNGTKLQKNILAALESFIEKTKPRMPVAPEQGARAQGDLLDWLLRVLGAEPDEFRKAWQVALVFFKEFHGNSNSPAGYTALSEYRSCAFREAWVDQDRLMAYTNLVTLLRATRNVKTRQNDIKTISLDKIAPELLDETSLSNLKRFYGV